MGHQELGQTHHPHPVEIRRLSNGTLHRLRCVLAFRSVQDDVSNQPYRRSEGCCLKGIQLFQRVTSVSTRRIRSWGACHHHRSRVCKSKQHSEPCDVSGSPAPAETHLIFMPAYCPFQELDFSEVTTTHTSQHLGFKLICHDSIQPIQQRVGTFGHEVVSVTPARSRRVSVVKESKHYLARVPSVRSEYSHVVPLPPFRSHSPAGRLGEQPPLPPVGCTFLSFLALFGKFKSKKLIFECFCAVFCVFFVFDPFGDQFKSKNLLLNVFVQFFFVCFFVSEPSFSF